MTKFYISSGSLKIIISKADMIDAAVYGYMKTNENDILDEYFYIDERGHRDYISADTKTNVIATEHVIRAASSELMGEDEPLP